MRVACVVGVVATAAWLRDFWDYDVRTDEHAQAERAARLARGEPVGEGAAGEAGPGEA